MSAKQVSDYLVYVAVRLAVCVLQAMTMEQARRLAAVFAELAYRLDARHREIALENLRRAMPGRYSEAELQTMVREVYRHFILVIVEIAHIPRKLHPTNWRKYIRLRDGHHVVDLLLRDQPVMLLTGHFGNWEMGGYAFGVFGFPLYSVARPLDNPYLDRFLRRFREATGQRMIPKKGGLDQALEVFEKNGALSLLADQNAGSRGLFVEFFGRPASTHKAIALLALQQGAPIVVGLSRRTGERFHYEVGSEEVIHPADLCDTPDAVRELTQRYTAALERLVRRDPTQYLWLHRRWKSQPGARRRRPKTRLSARAASL